MLDIKWIHEHPEVLDDSLKNRGNSPVAHEIIALDQTRKKRIQSHQELLTRRNSLAKLIADAKARQEEASDLIKEATNLREEIPALDEEVKQLQMQLTSKLAIIPNVPSQDVPIGRSEADNRIISLSGVKPSFSYVPKQHFEIGEDLGMMDFEEASKLSGARFVVLKGDLARLERALAAFMLDIHREEFNYLEVSPPYLVRSQAMYGAGQLPKFAEDAFVTTNDMWLIPTAEVSLTALALNKTYDEGQLPLRYVAYTPCFRSEAGSAGRDTRGMLRQHQFHKVELVSLTTPEQSENEHERKLKAAQTILERLNLHFRTVLLCTGDMGSSSKKTYDLEVWLPGQDAYREISSCSNCGDYQARRMESRVRRKDPEKKSLDYIHTLNGSGLAVGRTLIAVLENYQQPDGSVLIPEVLRPYFANKIQISRQ